MKNILRVLRIAHELRPKEVALKTGLKIGTVYKLESGESNVTYDTLRSYAKAFNMSVAEIYALIELQEQGATNQELLDIYLEHIYLNKPLYKVG